MSDQQPVPDWHPARVPGSKRGLVKVVGCLVAIVVALWGSVILSLLVAELAMQGSTHKGASTSPLATDQTIEPTPSRTSDATVPTASFGSDTIAFGTGGANCTLITTATTFSVRDRIRLVSAGVLGGGDVSIIWLQRDGRTVDGYPVARPVDLEAGCVYDLLPPLPAGQYTVSISVPPGSLVAPRFKGAFDVTP